jgi:hypothetical protein
VLRRLAVAERARLVDLRLQHPQQARHGRYVDRSIDPAQRAGGVPCDRWVAIAQDRHQARQGGRAQVAQRVAGQLMHGFLRVAGRGQGFG